MIRLYYTSELQPGIPADEIGKILQVARARNRQEGITGMLILHGDRVMQFLEGPEDKVRACYERITHDPRHSNVQPGARIKAQSRVFETWYMGVANVEDMPADLADSVRSLSALSDRLDQARAKELDWENKTVVSAMRIFLTRFRHQHGAGAI